MGATSKEPTEQATIDPGAAKELGDKMLAAWNEHNAEKLLALMTDDVVYDDSSWPRSMRGKSEVREFLESTWRAVPDLSFEFESAFPGPGMQVVNYWRATGTQTGLWDPPGLEPTGQSVAFEGAFFGELRDGRLTRIRVVYDVSAILRRVGVLPEQGSAAEKVAVGLANARTWVRKRMAG